MKASSHFRRSALARASVAALLTATTLTVAGPAAATFPEQPAGSAGGQWTRLFTDEFSGGSLDLTKWQPNWFGANDASITKGANSAESACMDPANVTVSSGEAHLALTTQTTTCNSVSQPRRGALIQTAADGLDWAPAADCNDECYFEARIKLPATANYVRNWPAFWTNGATATWPQGGENDIMENLGDASTTGDVQSVIHYYDGSTWSEDPASQTSFRDGGWHTYGSQWSADGHVRWYFDGTLIGTVTGAESWDPHYMILDYTTGTYGGPIAAGNTMDVDYVRVWGQYEPLAGNLISENHESFETSVGSWFAGNANTVISRQTTQAYTGGASMRVRSCGSGNIHAGLTTILVQPNTQYTVSFWAKTSQTGWTARAALDFYTGAGAGSYISSSAGTGVALTADTWTFVTRTFTTPANAGEVRLFAGQSTATAINQDLFIDSVYLG